jgi:dolichol-phosphate mannosyltransferase
LIKRIISTVEIISSDFEIILVEDGSTDHSWTEIEKACLSDSRVKGIKLSRNFGQHYAITAGLDNIKGEWIVVMDCDLQDQPEEIEKLFSKAQEGFDVVLGQRTLRKDYYYKRFFSIVFYKTLGYLTGTRQDSSIANFGIYNKKVVQSICSMRESIRYFPTMVKWVGYNQTSITINHSERLSGKSNYNFKKLINLGADIILANSEKPLRLMVKFGLLVFSISVLIAFYFLFKWYTGQIEILGYTSLIISFWLLSGLIIATLGIVGLYIGKTFEGVKNRPIYIIKEKTYE